MTTTLLVVTVLNRIIAPSTQWQTFQQPTIRKKCTHNWWLFRLSDSFGGKWWANKSCDVSFSFVLKSLIAKLYVHSLESSVGDNASIQFQHENRIFEQVARNSNKRKQCKSTVSNLKLFFSCWLRRCIHSNSIRHIFLDFAAMCKNSPHFRTLESSGAAQPSHQLKLTIFLGLLI